MLQVGREGLDFAENLVEGGVDFAENLVEGAVDSAPHIGEHIIDAAQDVGEHIGIPTSGDDDGDPSLDDVDMYAGAGPRDLDDGGPTGGGYAAKASLSNFKQLAEICLLDHKHTLRHQHISCTPRASQRIYFFSHESGTRTEVWHRRYTCFHGLHFMVFVFLSTKGELPKH